MNSRRSNKRCKRHPTAQSMTNETTAKIKVVMDGKNKLYRCLNCNETSKRRFNAERHHKRFHENISGKVCCDTTFCTKGDFYKHKEKVHNERKKYKERWTKETSQLSKSSIKQRDTIAEKESEDYADDITTSCVQNDAMMETSEFSNETIKKIKQENCTQTLNEDISHFEKLSAPKKFLLHRWKTLQPKKNFSHRLQMGENRSNGISMLESMENFIHNQVSRRTAMKNASKIIRSNSLNTITEKENILQIYNITDRSKEGIDKGLYSIKF